eukprot:TRINITY_DN33910_c0_g1_i1.p1 TRINITY_DN33910_c0_g1~~TRINITY_DN33910_c0_g1_i1.p1  ORF type:complete len:310 (-),score=46.16 TRINITY_DN33910_c0_g1_i1:626-1555(-)
MDKNGQGMFAKVLLGPAAPHKAQHCRKKKGTDQEEMLALEGSNTDQIGRDRLSRDPSLRKRFSYYDFKAVQRHILKRGDSQFCVRVAFNCIEMLSAVAASLDQAIDWHILVFRFKHLAELGNDSSEERVAIANAAYETALAEHRENGGTCPGFRFYLRTFTRGPEGSLSSVLNARSRYLVLVKKYMQDANTEKVKNASSEVATAEQSNAKTSGQKKKKAVSVARRLAHQEARKIMLCRKTEAKKASCEAKQALLCEAKKALCFLAARLKRFNKLQLPDRLDAVICKLGAKEELYIYLQSCLALTRSLRL